MKLFSRSKQHPPTLPSDEDLASFEQDLRKTADDFLRVRDRFFAIRRAKAKYEQATDIDETTLPQEELAQLEERVESLKITLESQLLSWREASEPFWQIVRYVGLGLAIGWALGFWIASKKASTDRESANLQSIPTLSSTTSSDSPRLLD